MKKNIKAISIGDMNGIGIKLLINLWKKKKSKLGKFVLVTNYNLFKKHLNKNNIKIPIINVKNIEDINANFRKYFLIFNIESGNNDFNTYNSLKKSYLLIKKKICTSLITLPINKEKIIKNIDSKFKDQTEFLSKLDNKKYSNMIFYSKKIIISILSTHIPIFKVSSFIKNKDLIYKKIVQLEQSLKYDLNISHPKIVICGMNPHAGENGYIGNEEIKYFKPIIKKLIKHNINISGPFSADTIFNKINIKKFDCFVAIYHDQGLIPFKLLTGYVGVNYTSSLDIIRTSPAHGTAINIKSMNKANDQSLINSFILSDKIYKNRIRNKIDFC
tara:strand:+ start:4467 stop:5456 length:990 start_codon:yes stop_codon:yes gene_type:complete